MDDWVDGSISLDSGWWLELPHRMHLAYDEEGMPTLESPTMFIRPQVFTFDASTLTEAPEQIAAGIVADSLDDLAGGVGPVPVRGQQWAGALCYGSIHQGTEQRLIASLAAQDTILNVEVDYLSVETQDQATWLVEHAAHRREDVGLTTELRAVGAHIVVPNDDGH